MKTIIRFFAIAAVCAATQTPPVFAQLNVPSDGSDGALNITNSTVIDLSMASYGTWTNNNSTNAGNGVYDPNKWAVVFKYSSVNIGPLATVTFLNHPTHAPVVWLVQSNIVINGTLSVDGSPPDQNYPDYLIPLEPGPGGFRGAAFSSSGDGGGYGPGGSSPGDQTSGSSYGSSYGNPQSIPLFGGSGSGARDGFDVSHATGGSGAGAILLVSGTTVTINGSISAQGVAGAINYYGGSPYYSVGGGGAIRLVGNSIQGSGSVTAGVVRTEANSISTNIILNPNTVAVSPGSTPIIWASTNAPIVTVISVNGSSAPADPQAGVGTSSDVNISTNNPVAIILQAQNFPPSGSVVVRVTPKYANYFNLNASYVSGTFAQSTWQATTTLPNGFCVLQAHATSP